MSTRNQPAIVDQPGVYEYVDARTGGHHYAFILRPPSRAKYARAIVTAPTRHLRIPLDDIVRRAYAADTPTRQHATRWLRATRFLRDQFADTPATRRTLRDIRTLSRGEVAA